MISFQSQHDDEAKPLHKSSDTITTVHDSPKNSYRYEPLIFSGTYAALSSPRKAVYIALPGKVDWLHQSMSPSQVP